MRILHAISCLDPSHGGPTFCVTRLAAAQAGLGHEVSLVYFPTPTDKAREQLDALPGGRAVTLRPLGARPDRDAVTGFDHAHFHGVWERLHAALGAQARQAGIPYAVSPHGMLDPWSLRQSSFKKRIALSLYARKMLNGAAFIHALNADEARLMKPLALGPEARVIPNGVFLEELSPAPTSGAFRREHAELRDDPYILFLSRLHPKKGLDLLARAFARVLESLPAARLVVAGPDGGALASFRALATEHGILPRTLLPGPLYGSAKLAAIAGAACFCLPSRQEGFSVAILEALASGIPVVISEPCNFPEVAQRGAGVVVPLDTDTISSALTEVLSNPSRAADMGRAGATMVREQYTWPRIARDFLSAYESSSSS